ncbi:hypothetical protein AAH450_08010 [Erwinia sp. P7711]|uniref:hypothetical protein n=1 Tax=Erwinia sp. P7711 TaxID=3141451 RepID=UPI00318BBAD0
MANLNEGKSFNVKLRTKDAAQQCITAIENPLLAGGWLLIKTPFGYSRTPESQIISYSVERDVNDLAGCIANSIDDYNKRFADVALLKLEGKTAVTFLDDRFTVIAEKLTPDECREAIDHIRRKRCGLTLINHE